MLISVLATMGHEQAMRALPAWRVIFGTLEKQEQSQAVSPADAAGPCPALALPAH